ncbi:MAG: dolichyl-phosphate-mannose--protein mannosyltransferase [Actinomycetes bacterium]
MPRVTVTDAPAHPRAPRRVSESGLRRHLVGRRPTDRLWGWVGPLVVTALAGVLRFWRLDQPAQLVFDETYYVKQGYSLLRFGYERRWPEGADEKFTTGVVDVFLAEADFPVHPPVGKWMIAAGQWLLGAESSWGWRFSAALVGTLSVLMVARIARRLFNSTILGVVAGLLLAVDGHHLVHSRTSLLDIFLSFWVLAAFGALLADRERTRVRLARLVAARSADGGPLRGVGPGLGLRPWRLLAGVCLGLAVGTKWSALFFVAAFGLLTVLWDVGARRATGASGWRWALLRDGAPAFVSIVPVAAVTYVATWAGWFASEDAHLRRWGAQNPDAGWGFLPDALRSLGKYHADIWGFHTTLTSDHPYEAHPWSWIVQGRPTSFFYEGPKRGEEGCLVESCSQAITSVGNPVVWWGGTVAIAVLLFSWLLRRDWRAGAVLAGIAAGWLPWFYYDAADDRTMYAFYSVAFVPFVVLGLTYVLGLALGPREAPAQRRMVGAVAAGAVVVAAVVLLAFFWPVHVAEVIPYSQWRARMWFSSWI